MVTAHRQVCCKTHIVRHILDFLHKSRVASPSPTNWGVSPEKALDWVRSDMIPYYPLGVYKDVDAIEGGAAK